MSANESNVSNPACVIELNNQPVLVTGYVESDSIVSKYARVPVHGFDLVGCCPVRGPRFLKPGFNRLFSIRVNLKELSQCADSNDSHQGSLACSHIGNNRLIN